MRALITGGRGMLGSSIAECWRAQRASDPLRVLTRDDVDLRDRDETRVVIAAEVPDLIIHAAARVGGISAKITHPTEYLLDNLLIDISVIGAALDLGVTNLLYVGSAAVYPENHPQPFVEADVLAGSLESANEGYALAKISAMKLCEYASQEFGVNYRAVVPSNLYGPNDDYSLSHGHLVAAAIAKVHAAKSADLPTVTAWGDGTARREFTYVDDLARWLVEQIDHLADWPGIVNVGVGVDHSVAEYYEIARRVVGYSGDLVFDASKPSGMERRVLDSSAARALGWSPATSLEAGMAEAYRRFIGASKTRKA